MEKVSTGNINGIVMSVVCRPKFHWGPHLWGFIHTITVIDFDDNFEFHRNIVENLRGIYNVFPCPTCKELYKIFLQKLDLLDLREPMVLFYWSVDLHNAVNTKLRKPLWSYERATAEWCTKMKKT